MLALIFACCGFYVAGSGHPLTNDATQVVLMREGTRTVMSIQNDYQGPPEAFAMVVPVPVVLHEGDVKTLPKEVFQHIDAIGAPRLVEYWEQDPCRPQVDVEQGAPAQPEGVDVEAKFTVGEYQIVILSAKDSTDLDTWLRSEKYNIPAGVEPLLEHYVASGMKFFVAKVDPTKVTFENGHAALSPLRFSYDSETFELPIRLGLANSAGTQDLIVNILAPNQRYQVANYPNVMIPTNLDVGPAVKDHFAEFYAALFDQTLEKHPGAVVTEYSGQASIDPSELMTLGADVLPGSATDFVLTRLHARYGKDIKNDLVFAAASPFAFQARYAIRHPWNGPLRCEHPRRDVSGVKPALGLAGPLPPQPEVPVGSKPKSGCGCQSSDPAGLLPALLALRSLRRRKR
jgi:uncharacterized protein (TIGR03382 family)